MKRISSTAGGVVLAIAVAWPIGRAIEGALRPSPRPPPEGRIVPAGGGALEELAIQFHRDTGGEAFLDVYAAIFEALTPDTLVRVVVGDAEDEAIFEEARRRHRGGGPRVRYVHVGRRITNWARDRMAVLADVRGDPVLVAPPRAHAGARARANDWQVPWALRRALGARGRIVTAPFAFDGGDLIADEDAVYVASPLFDRNPERSPRVLLREIETLTGRPVVRLGAEAAPTPDHHVGMFVTPLGDGVVARADPRLGSALLFGDDGALADGDATAPGRTVTAGGTTYEVDERRETRQRFARVEADLRRAGRQTFTLPVVPTTTPYVWLGYDNVLLDAREDGLHVLMPVYGVPALDDAAAEIWRGRGATVHRIDVSEVFGYGGTVRCLGAVLRRYSATSSGGSGSKKRRATL